MAQFGISEWVSIDPSAKDEALDLMPARPGVYVFRAVARLFQRVQSESDIVYVGRARRPGGVRARVADHFVPGTTGTPSGRLYQFAEQWGYDLEIAWITPQDPDQIAATEREILEKFEEDHHDLPPVNRSMPSA